MPVNPSAYNALNLMRNFTFDVDYDSSTIKLSHRRVPKKVTHNSVFVSALQNVDPATIDAR